MVRNVTEAQSDRRRWVITTHGRCPVCVHSPKPEKERCVARNPEMYLLLGMYILECFLPFPSSFPSNADDSQMCKFPPAARVWLLTLLRCISTSFVSQFMVFQACHISPHKTEPLIWNPPTPPKNLKLSLKSPPVWINSNFIYSLA